MPAKMETIAFDHVIRQIRTQLTNYVCTTTTIHDFIPIDPKAFPPLRKLSVKQVRQLTHHITKLLQFARIHPIFPAGLPTSRKYMLLKQLWIQPYFFRPGQSTYIQFCRQDTQHCAYGKAHCVCANTPNYWDEY
jgi:hypothetical protein